MVINKPFKYKKLHKVMWCHHFRLELEEYLPVYKDAFDQSYEESEAGEVEEVKENKK